MRTPKHDRMYARIEKHGRQLLALFPQALEQDPIALCRKLRRLEQQGNTKAEQYCNGVIDSGQWERFADKLRDKATELLMTDRVWINGDPRGYALKIDLRPGEELHRDWGGYGIIAPDLTED